jgi:TRAP-type C4-dicarboxylate transport system permease small subunit
MDAAFRPHWSYRTAGLLTTITGTVGRIGVVLLMLHVVADVVMRFAFDTPIVGTLEFSQFWYLIVIAFLGLALAERRDDHIAAPILFDRLSTQMKKEFTVIGSVLTIVLLLAIAWWGWEEAVTQMDQEAAGIVSGLAIWPPRFLVPIGAVAFAIELLLRRFGPKQPQENTEQESPDIESGVSP